MFYFAIVKNDDGEVSISGLFMDKDREIAEEKAKRKAAELELSESDELITYIVVEANGP